MQSYKCGHWEKVECKMGKQDKRWEILTLIGGGGSDLNAQRTERQIGYKRCHLLA